MTKEEAVARAQYDNRIIQRILELDPTFTEYVSYAVETCNAGWGVVNIKEAQMKYKPGTKVHILDKGNFIISSLPYKLDEIYGVAQWDGYLHLFLKKTREQVSIVSGDLRTTWCIHLDPCTKPYSESFWTPLVRRFKAWIYRRGIK